MKARLAKFLKLDKYFSFGVILFIDLFISVACTLAMCAFTRLIPSATIPFDLYPRILVLSFGASVAAFLLFSTFRQTIRHMRLRDTWRLSLAVLVKVAIIYPFLARWTAHIGVNVAPVAAIFDLLLTTLLLSAVRMAMILLYEAFFQRYSIEKRTLNTLIYGDGSESVTLAMRMHNSENQTYMIRGLVAECEKSRSLSGSGFKIYQFCTEEEFESIVRRKSINAILFPDYKSAKAEKDGVIRYCERLKLKPLISPPVDEIRDGKVMKQDVRKITVEDILGRDEIRINMDQIVSSFRGKTVLVTGAAGSIGSELCRQLAQMQIAELVMFDSAETPTHNLRLELEERFPGLLFYPIVGDVRIKSCLRAVFKRYHPDIVFHAAAYKHVPLMEENPTEATLVNVYGTRNVADLCVAHRVEKMVMISTDKAVNPTNIMGASKRLAEIYVQSLGLAIENGEVNGVTQFITTRFGNVLGSNGSVIPRFREQIEHGGPITVTHPDIIRFFMTIPEACRLVMEAATMGRGNEIFVFDMGEPVLISSLAERMIELAGCVPGKDIEIRYTGLRPGEKLFEEMLSSGENTLPTTHEKIRIAKVRNCEYDEIKQSVNMLAKYAMNMMVPETVSLLKALIPEYISQNSDFEMYDIGTEREAIMV